MYYDPDPSSSSEDPTPDPDRRVVYVAVINCIDQAPISNSGGPYQVEAWAKMFSSGLRPGFWGGREEGCLPVRPR